jgi:hypothetical protein
VTEPANRQKRSQPPLSEIELIVKPLGNPAAIRVFTAAERADAEVYATSAGSTLEALL